MTALQPAVSVLEGAACATTELLRAPGSGRPCVHWRVRVIQHLTPRTTLVHEAASPDAFEIEWCADLQRGPVRVRIDPAAARIEAAPVLHREGSPAAQAVARQLGLGGVVSVEEVVILQGEDLQVEGWLDDPASSATAAMEGPFRGGGRPPEVRDATVRLTTRAVGPTLLPWALGTAAALLGGLGTAAYAAQHVLGRSGFLRVLPAEIGPMKAPRHILP